MSGNWNRIWSFIFRPSISIQRRLCFRFRLRRTTRRELADNIGLFSTLGMAEDHNGLNNGRLDEAAYLQQCELVLSERERTMRFELDRFSEGFFFMLFDTPDRVQHMLWRFPRS